MEQPKIGPDQRERLLALNRSRDKRYRENNPERAKALRRARVQKWRKNNPLANKEACRRAYLNQRNKVSYRLAHSLRNRLIRAIKNKQKQGSALVALGCSVEFFKAYLENLFLPGMTWDNWSHKGWHIDHIKPLSSFDLSKPEEVKSACHFSNMQPLWAVDNLKKGAK